MLRPLRKRGLNKERETESYQQVESHGRWVSIDGMAECGLEYGDSTLDREWLWTTKLPIARTKRIRCSLQQRESSLPEASVRDLILKTIRMQGRHAAREAEPYILLAKDAIH